LKLSEALRGGAGAAEVSIDKLKQAGQDLLSSISGLAQMTGKIIALHLDNKKARLLTKITLEVGK